jgi:hypothetical protein
MKPYLIIPISLAMVSCTVIPASVMRQGSQGTITQFGGKLELVTADASAKVDNSVSFRDATKAITGTIRDYLIGKVIAEGFDSYNATKASDNALKAKEISAQTEAAKIASDEKIALEKLALEAAEMEAGL